MNALYLVHSGTKGMKWGTRRWQNPDGTLTEEGKKHYGYRDKNPLNITAATQDADIIRGVLGDAFEEVQKMVIAMQQQTGRENFTEEELKQILGDNYEIIQKEIREAGLKRDELKKNAKNYSVKKKEAEVKKEEPKKKINVRESKYLR